MRRWLIAGATLALAGFDSPPPAKDAGGSADASSSSSSSSTSSSSSGGSSTSSSGGSSTSSSGGSTSSSGGSSGTTAGGACGVCDRDWTCNGITDSWLTEATRCVNQRTKTALRCDGKFDQGTSYNVGTWSGGPTKITLVYPMLGGGTKSYDCYP